VKEQLIGLSFDADRLTVRQVCRP